MTPNLYQPSPSLTDVLPGRRFPLVLMYHRVAEVAHDPHSLAVSPRRFTQQMAWLKRRRLRGVAIGQLVDAVCSGTDKGLVGITFDDGYADLVDEVPTMLQHYGFSATVFVVTRRLGSVNDWDLDTPWQLLDADSVRMVAEAGLEIASHGRTHISLAGIDPAVLRDETYGSRTDLDRLLGAPVRGFAYPYGSVDGPARAAVSGAGYTYACAVFAPRQDQSLLALPRIFVGEGDGKVRLAAKRLLFRWHVSSQRGLF
jgi:peptidoglycan/xylan/chitin deacetylase (PgdA/CDA1 family)